MALTLKEKTRMQEKLKLLQQEMREVGNAIKRLEQLEVAVEVLYDTKIKMWREQIYQGHKKLQDSSRLSKSAWRELSSETSDMESKLQEKCLHGLLLQGDGYSSRNDWKHQVIYKCIICGKTDNKANNKDAFIKNVEHERCPFKEPNYWYQEVDWFTFSVFSVDEDSLISLFL